MQNTAGSGDQPCECRLAGKKIILGVTGGIAAYKAASIASALVQRGADVHVVMTGHASKLIGAATFWGLTHNPVLQDVFEPPARREITHVSLPETADLFVVAPATANVIAKLANGIADDMLTTMALVARCPMLIAPAMNVNMYRNAFVVANVETLRQHGFHIVEPESGMLACGDEGIGRLADPEVVLRRVDELLLGGPRDYEGVGVLVTAGPTQEPLDPVRYITNRSSGRMGFAIAEAAVRRGARVTLVSGPTEIEPPAGVDVVQVRTVQEMHEAVVSRAEDMRLVISAAAPADFTPAQVMDQKIKKTERWTLELDKAVDILAELGRHKGARVLVGFAAETTNLEEHAQQKLERKNLDLIVANDVSGDVFGSDSNQVTLISRSGDKIRWPRMSKREVAGAILDYVRDHFLEERA